MAELSEFIEHGREEVYLEYKQSQPWNVLRAKIARTALGMANVRDGGTIVIGIAQTASGFEPVGVPSDDDATYNEDDVRSFVNAYAEPPIRLDMYRAAHSGKIFIVIVVHEFDHSPVIARQQGEGIRRGAIYTRSARAVETREVQDEHDMRLIIDIATEKALTRFLGTLERSGVPPSRLAGSMDVDAFERERRGL